MKSKIDLMEYQPLLHKVAGKFPSKYKEDLMQEGFLALHRASELYDDQYGTPFQTYAYKEVYGTMLKFVEDQNNTTSLDNTITDEDGDTTTHADLLESDTDVELEIVARDYWNTNMESSTPIERFIKERHYKEGLTPQEIIQLYCELIQIYDVRAIKKILKK